MIAKNKIPVIVRHAVWDKYFYGLSIGKCTCCNITPISLVNFDCGHIVSEKDGGKITLDNLRPICRPCNLSMKTKNMNNFIEEFGFNKINIIE